MKHRPLKLVHSPDTFNSDVRVLPLGPLKGGRRSQGGTVKMTVRKRKAALAELEAGGKPVPNPLRSDPTRTGKMRAAMAAHLDGRFAELARRLAALGEEDAWGTELPARNANPNHDEKGRFSSSPGTGTDSESFKKWFAGSKVVDEDGKPLVLFHGTQKAGFDQFETPAYFTTSAGETGLYSEQDSFYRFYERMPKTKNRPAEEAIKDLPVSDGLSHDPDWPMGEWRELNGAVVRKTGMNEYGDNKGEVAEGLRVDFDYGLGGYKQVPMGEAFNPGTYAVHLSIKNPVHVGYATLMHLSDSHVKVSEDAKRQVEEWKRQGYDGATSPGDMTPFTQHWLAFEPEQIKSVFASKHEGPKVHNSQEPFPAVLQRHDWDCGPACLEAVCRWLGKRCPESVEASPAHGMNPLAMAEALRAAGIDAQLEHFSSPLDLELPALCLVQHEEPARYRNGHWVVVTEQGHGMVRIMCPLRGFRWLTAARFDERWHDRDSAEREWIRCGIEVRRVTENSNNPEGCNQYSGPGCSDVSQYKEKRHSDVERVTEDADKEAAEGVMRDAGLAAVLYTSKEPLLVHKNEDGDVDGALMADLDGGMSFDFGVVPSAQGSGVGKKLLEEAVGYYLRNFRKLAKKQGLEPEEYDLYAIPSNPIAAKMMEKLGFEKDGESYVIKGSRVMVGNVSSQEVDAAAAQADPAPTPAQREAGNYAKGHVTFAGLPVTIETAAGNKRKPWHDKPLAAHYGYVKARGGIQRSDADGDHVDCFLGPNPDSDRVFVVDQRKEDGVWDEHKALLGWDDAASAKAAYLASYPDGWDGLGGMRELSLEDFKLWLGEGDTSKPIAEWPDLEDEGRKLVEGLLAAHDTVRNCGGKGGTMGPCPKGQDFTRVAKVRNAVTHWQAKAGGALGAFIDRIPGGRFLKGQLAAKMEWMKRRYGEKTMKRIVAGATVLSWTLAIGGAAHGVVIYAPIGGLTAVGAVLAEAHLQGKRLVGKVTGNAEQARDELGRFTSGGEPLTEHEEAAHASADKTAKLFGLPKPNVQFHRLEGERTYGEHGGEAAHLVNVHAGNPINKQINFPLDRKVTEGEHLAAHEVTHQAFSADADAGRKAMEELKNVKAEFGNAVSMYGAFNGAHENLMELGAVYSHSPEALKRYSPEMHSIAKRWADGLSSQEKRPTANTRFAFHSSPEKVKAFQRWLQLQVAQLLLSQDEDELWRRYAEEGYKKGQARAFDDTNAASIGQRGGVHDFYKGTREQFLRSSFGQPVSIERIKVLAGRSFDEMRNVTHDMATKMSRVLTDGLTQGKHSREVAKDLVREVGLGRNRARMVASTELIRAHNHGQLDSFKAQGMDRVGVQAEVMTARDNVVCPICQALEGQVFDIDAAYGILPAHVSCRCCFRPAIGKALSRIRNPTTNRRFYPWPVRNEVHDVSDEARDARGRWTSQGGETLHAAVRTNGKWHSQGKEVPAHVKALAIPPGWSHVFVNHDPKGTILARGKDAKGREQKRYSKEHEARQAEAKFRRVREYLKQRGKMLAELETDARERPELRDTAEALRVVMQTGARPGSEKDTGAEHKSYGVTTLEGRHVLEGGRLLRFVAGKHGGKEVEFRVDDPKTAALLAARAKGAGASGKLFPAASAVKLQQYSKTKDGGGLKPKDARTAVGTETATREVTRADAPKTAKEYKAAVMAVALTVSKRLGNTPAIALKSYIDPSVFKAWKEAAVLNVFDEVEARDARGKWTKIVTVIKDSHELVKDLLDPTIKHRFSEFTTSFDTMDGVQELRATSIDKGRKNGNWKVEFGIPLTDAELASRDRSMFGGGLKTRLTGSGKALETLSKVLESLKMLISARRPQSITFSAAEDEESRVRLYDRLVNKLAFRFGYLIKRKQYSTLVEYRLVRYALDKRAPTATTANTFCATGKGGGIDAHCGKAGKQPFMTNTPNKDVPDESRPEVTKETADFLNNYSWGYDGKMNAALRTTGKPPEGPFGGNEEGKPNIDGVAMFEALQRTFAKAPLLPKPVAVVRTIHLGKKDKVERLAQAAEAAAKAGGVMEMPGFVSTSTGNSGFEGDVKMVIRAIHGLDMVPYSHFPDEREFLLNHNSKFLVRKVNRMKNGDVSIHLEQLPPDSKATVVGKLAVNAKDATSEHRLVGDQAEADCWEAAMRKAATGGVK